MFRKLAFCGLILLVVCFYGVSVVMAQDSTAEPLPSPTEAVISPIPEQPESVTVIPVDELQDMVHTNVLVFVLLFAGITIVVGGLFMGWAVQKVARLIPADLLPAFYQGVNTVYSRRQSLAEQLAAAAKQSTITEDDLIAEAARKAAVWQWQKFIDEAREAGVQLPPVDPDRL